MDREINHPSGRRAVGAVLALRVFGAAAALLAGAAQAQDTWPARTITLIAPFPAGSGTDISARLLAKDMAEYLGQTVVVDNRPGANGALGAQLAARAKPDGHTLMIGSATTNAANFAFFPGKLGYEPTSFEMVSGLGSVPISLYVPFNSPWKTLADLVAEARRAPGKLNCGSGNAVTQVACEVFRKAAGIQATNVPYKGNPLSLTDVVGGQISYAFSDASAALVFIDGKKLRALAVAAEKRLPTMPDTATFREQGFADFEFTAWSALFAPAGTPAAVMERLNAAVRRSSESPESVAIRQRSGASAMVLSLADARRFATAEVERWARYVRESGIKPE